MQRLKPIALFLAIATVLFIHTASAQESMTICSSFVPCSSASLPGQPSGTPIIISASCSGGCATSNEYSYIVDAGTGSCPAGASGSPPSIPATCSGMPAPDFDSDTASGPCSLTSLVSGESVSTTLYPTTTSTTGVTHNICAYSTGGTSWETTSGSIGVVAGGSTNNQLPAGIVTTICSVYFAVNTIVFVLALTLMILGGAVYAGAQILPGQARGTIQGYAMGLVFGGVAGAIIALAAPWVLSIIYNSTAAIVQSSC